MVEVSDPQQSKKLRQAFDLYRSVGAVIALPIFEELATLGNVQACVQLGRIYRLGELGDPDLSAAEKWYLRLLRMAEEGVSDAQWELSELYQWSEWFEQNFERAKYWRGLAATSGQAEAQFRLYELYSAGPTEWGYDKNEARGMLWLARAVAQDHPEALYALAGNVLEGRHRERPLPAEGIRLLQRSAEFGFAPALEALEGFGLYPMATTASTG